MGCGGSKNTRIKEETDSDDEDYDKYNTKNKSNNSSPRQKYNNNTSYGNYNNSNKTTPVRTGGTQTVPEYKYAVSTTTDSNYDEFPEANDRQGYKRRIRSHLIQVTSGSSIEDIEKSMEKFEKNHLEDCGDLSRARDRLQYLKLKRGNAAEDDDYDEDDEEEEVKIQADLRDAIRRSNVGVLEKTIAEAHGSRYARQLRGQIEAAERKLEHLRELNKYNHDILTMDQSTISEIHSYHRPPACVHDVMAASYMLLGHEEATLRDWSYLQSMAGKVGRDSLIHKVRDFDSSNVDEKTASRVRTILNYHDLGEIRVASNGAATFHVWASNIVDMIEKDQEDEYEQRRKQEEDRLRREAEGQSEKHTELTAKTANTTKGKGR